MLKSIKQRYSPTSELLYMMESSRQISNECIRIGLRENKTSLKSLCNVAYHSTKRYPLNTAYRLCAISKAAGILTNYRKLVKKGKSVRKPYCWTPVLITCYQIKVKDGFLYLPSKISIPLNKHTLKVLSDPNLEIHSVTLNTNHLSIAYSKKIDYKIECTGTLGIDRNVDNVTAVDNLGKSIRYDLSQVTKIKSQIRDTKSHLKRNDVRIRKQIFQKYGKIQTDRVLWILHNTSKKIIEYAKENKLDIVMENIKNIRKLYRKGNGQGKKYRGRMNSWSYYELQRQIQYKAEWEGLKVIYVNPWGTSSKCVICGDKLQFTEEHRMLRCPTCDKVVDRDVNAAMNIANAGLRFSLKGSSDEVMKGNQTTTVIPVVNGDQLTLITEPCPLKTEPKK